jgi:hypothetical protein
MITALGIVMVGCVGSNTETSRRCGMWRSAIAEKLLTCFKVPALRGFLLVGGGWLRPVTE